MSPNDWNGSSDQEGADGWVDEEASSPPPRAATESDLHGADADGGRVDSQRDLARTRDTRPARTNDKKVRPGGDDGKPMAILAHLSVLFGLPIFVIPLIQRDNALALHHAKAAAVIYGMFLIAGAASMVTCGLALPLMLLCYVPAVIGIVQAANGEQAGKWGMGDFGEQIFSGLEVKDD